MKNERNQKCPKCGKKNKACQCKKTNPAARLMLILTAIVILCLAFKTNIYSTYQYRLAIYKLQKTISSLPDQAVKDFWQNKLNAEAENFQIEIYWYDLAMPEFVAAPQENRIAINAPIFNAASLEHRWCLLVHEHQHFEYAKSHTATLTAELGKARDEYYDEHSALRAEIIFAQKQNLLAEFYPDVVRYTQQFGLEQAIHMACIDYLIHAEFYQKHWSYFIEIFNNEIAPQYPNLHQIQRNS